MQRIDRLILLEKDPGQTIKGMIFHGFGHVAVNHCLQSASGAMMHPVGQLEITQREFSLVKMRVQAVEFWLVELIDLPQFGIQS